ncbi:MAG: 3-hydroxyacyl-CoA dehydrogenase family protein [Bacteroidia bacterium]
MVYKSIALGSRPRLQAFAEGIGKIWQTDLWESPFRVPPSWRYYDVIIDLEADERPLPYYPAWQGKLILLQAVKKPLRLIFPAGLSADRVLGVNLLPYFCMLSHIELSALSPLAVQAFADFYPAFTTVPDQVGMVRARVLAMIINEAYHLKGETHLDPQTIDLAMQLGVNYPEGPFSWAQKIGLTHIRDILWALYKHCGPAYMPAPLLEQEIFTL